jgi:hypothetical protein
VPRARNVALPILAPILTRFGCARAVAFHFVSQLGIRYHASRFVEDAAPTTAPRAWRRGITAGRRAPDAAVSAERRMFDLLDGYRFHVVVLSRRPLDGEEIGRVRAELDALPAATGLDLPGHLVARSLVGRDARVLQAESPQVFRAYGLSRRVPQATFLVRPDGYVAYRAPNGDVAAVARFARERFGTP